MSRPAVKDLRVIVVTPRETGLPERYTYQAIRRGELPALWTGKGFLIPLKMLHQFIETRAGEEARDRARKARQAAAPAESPA